MANSKSNLTDLSLAQSLPKGDDQLMTKMAAVVQDAPVVKTFRVRVGVPELSVHNGPGGKETGRVLHGNEVYEVLNVAGRDAWLEIAPGEWVRFQDNERTNLTPIGG